MIPVDSSVRSNEMIGIAMRTPRSPRAINVQKTLVLPTPCPHIKAKHPHVVLESDIVLTVAGLHNAAHTYAVLVVVAPTIRGYSIAAARYY